MEADGDNVNLATPFPPPQDTVVDNSSPAPVTAGDNTAPSSVIQINNYDQAASTTNQSLPPKIAVKVNRDKINPKTLQIAIGISDIDSVDLSISFDFSSLMNQIDSTTVDNNPLFVSSGDGEINPDGDPVRPESRISSGGGGKTH